MVRRLAEHIVDWQIKRHFLKAEERGLYLYAYEVLINQMTNILIAILLAILFRAPLPVFTFLVSYIPLRAFGGGHHAKTNERCMFVSAVLISIVCLITKILPEQAVIVTPAAFVISGIMIFCYAPVGDANKPLTGAEVIRYRKISRYLWLAESIAGMFFFFIRHPVSVVLAISHLILCVMLFLGILKNKTAKIQG